MQVHVEETKLVGASPAKVYAILAEPRHHKHILPEEFTKFVEESDGTISVDIKISGATRTFRMKQEQVTPNQLFRETDLNTDIVTDFRLEEHPDGTLVTIATKYNTKGFTGFLESLFAPAVLRRLFDAELTKLCRYALIADVN